MYIGYEDSHKTFGTEGVKSEIYKVADKWVIGVRGGFFEGKNYEPEAIILENRPIPLHKWTTPTEKRENLFLDETSEHEYVFREFSGDKESIYLLEMNSNYYKDGSFHFSIERTIFVSKEYLEKKVIELRDKASIATFSWLPNELKWKEVERLYTYEFEELFSDGDEEEV